MKTIYLDKRIDEAVEIIKNGGLVAVPTETVYGLSADGRNAEAVEKIYIVKGRPETKPINLLVSGMKMVEEMELCRDISEEARILADRFWPGPLTMIFKRYKHIPDIVTAGGGTLGVRCPDNDLTLELIKRAAIPLATPSANPSGMASPTDAQMVRDYFDGKIDCIIDGGKCQVGVASTILDMTGEKPKILRLGVLTKEIILRETGIEVI